MSNMSGNNNYDSKNSNQTRSSGTDAGQELRGAMDDFTSSVSNAAAETSQATQDVASTAKDAIVAAARAATSQASGIVGNVAAQLGSSVEEQKGRGADSLSGFAHAIKTAAAELDQQSPGIARQFRGASDRIERFSGSLRDRRVEDLITDYSNLAKTQPVAFFAGALIAGFALSRFVKSTANATPSKLASSTPSGSEGI